VRFTAKVGEGGFSYSTESQYTLDASQVKRDAELSSSTRTWTERVKNAGGGSRIIFRDERWIKEAERG